MIEFDSVWLFYQDKTILSQENLKIIYENILKTKPIYGSTAEIGVYKGYTSKMIAQLTNKSHFCYDTFEGIVQNNFYKGDHHLEKEFSSSLEEVVKNINNKNVVYRKGVFPETFKETALNFSFVYSDTKTYYGAKNTMEMFSHRISSKGKILFYVDEKCQGVQKFLDKFNEKDLLFDVEKTKNIIIFTKK
jgi:hypothetical protein